MQSRRPIQRAVVVGGSLVGLATAIRLAREEIAVTVLERSPRFPEGTGLGIDREQLSALTGVSAFGEGKRAAHPVVRSGRESTSWSAVCAWLQSLAQEEPAITVLGGETVVDVRSNANIAVASTGDASFEADLMSAPTDEGA